MNYFSTSSLVLIIKIFIARQDYFMPCSLQIIIVLPTDMYFMYQLERKIIIQKYIPFKIGGLLNLHKPPQRGVLEECKLLKDMTNGTIITVKKCYSIWVLD